MFFDFSRLRPLGWRHFFFRQLTLEQLERYTPARVVNIERDAVRADAGGGSFPVTLGSRLLFPDDPIARPTVGDWLLVEPGTNRAMERLERFSLIHRLRPGESSDSQAIAANVDRLLVVTALTQEFNLHRIERYLVIAAQAGVTPLIVLSKADLCPDPAAVAEEASRRLRGAGDVVALDLLRDSAHDALGAWLDPGTTLALVGSSGVGKSTLLNNLAGNRRQATGTTREDDKGRHTTTSRSLHRLPGELCLIDVPGLREVGLPPVEGGVVRRFAHIEALAPACRFADCTHQGEPGCAVRAAVAAGGLAADELDHYLRLRAEEAANTRRRQQRSRQQEKAFGKMVRATLRAKRERQGR